MPRIARKVSVPRYIAVDTETTGLSAYRGDRAFMVCTYDPSTPGDEVKVYEWKVNFLTREVEHKIDPSLQEVLGDEKITKVFHNAKFDLTHLRFLGYEVKGRIEDTSFASRITNNLRTSYGLKYLCSQILGISDEDEKELSDVVSKMRISARKKNWSIAEDKEADYWITQYYKELGFEDFVGELCKKYCVMDVYRTGKLWEYLYPKLSDPNFSMTYEMELRLLQVVMAMEDRGMAIYINRAKKEAEDSRQKAEHHLSECRRITGKPDFNPGSSPQLSRVLYDEKPGEYYPLKLDKKTGKRVPNLKAIPDRYPVVFGLKVHKKTSGGERSTDWKALRPHQEHPLVRELLMYRSAFKALNTFYLKYIDMSQKDKLVKSNPEDPHRIIHTSLNQCGTTTGRFSSSDPNLQQVANPESSPRGTDVHARRPFGPRPGYNWYTIDYAQMELRVFADCAQVPAMLREIYEGRDLNNFNTNRAWGGRNNPSALEAMAHSLELGHDYPAKEEIQKVWDEYGWNSQKSKSGMRSAAALAMAEWYLERYNYDIVKAEKSIGKSQSRQRGKTVMFVKMYGGGGSAAADLLYISPAEAQKFLNQFDEGFPEINDFINRLSSQAKAKGYIITPYGRKLQIDPEFSYRSVNYLIQGCCADLMKESIIRTHELFRDSGLDAHVLMTIHDEMIVEIRKEHAKKWLLREICRIMTDTEGRLSVPMGVEIKRVSSSWESKESVQI
jgi:DNA polymerase I-like protein with 3'-5' exonuclease and polymerase domains